MKMRSSILPTKESYHVRQYICVTCTARCSCCFCGGKRRWSASQTVSSDRSHCNSPLTYRATDEELNDLRRRVAATRLPDKEPVSDFSQGVKLATVQKLA